MKINKNKVIGNIGIFISVILTFFFSELVLMIKKFAEKNISQDHYIGAGGIEIIKLNLLFLIILLIFFSVILSFNLLKKVRKSFNNFVDLNSVIKFVLSDDVCSNRQLPVYLFVISTISALFLHLYLIYFGEPTHEGFLETYSSVFFLISGILTIFSITKINNNQFSNHIKKKLRFILIIISIIFFFIYFEEISWGQNIFNWKSFGVFTEYNFQNETNYHNFFNPFYRIIYPVFGLCLFIFLFLIWVFPIRRSFLYKLLLPPKSFIYITLIMSGASFRGHSEIFEELFSIFCLLYSFRILICLNPKNRLKK